jgi:hypothetical protein
MACLRLLTVPPLPPLPLFNSGKRYDFHGTYSSRRGERKEPVNQEKVPSSRGSSGEQDRNSAVTTDSPRETRRKLLEFMVCTSNAFASVADFRARIEKDG